MTTLAPSLAQTEIIDQFHKLLYEGRDGNGGPWFDNTTWFGVPLWKMPLDLWVYQEILAEVKPEVIVETGTWMGGSALYLACLCDLLGVGHVYSIDVALQPDRPRHQRITYVEGASTDPRTVKLIAERCVGRRTLVILDSDHSRDHVYAEMQIYSMLVSVGSYMIVEDGDLNGHPVVLDHGPGPAEAIDDFLPDHPEFEQDRAREKFLVTFHPGGYLKRVGATIEKPGQNGSAWDASGQHGDGPALVTAPAPRSWASPIQPSDLRPAPAITQLPSALSLLRQYEVPRTLHLVDRADNNQGVWRVAWPSLFADAHGLVAQWSTYGQVEEIQAQLSAGKFNLVVTPRWTFTGEEAHARWAEDRKRDRLAWAFETDDDLFSKECVEREVRVFGSSRKKMEAHRQSRLRMLTDCDGVIVSREPLAAVVRRYTDRPVIVVPNAIDVAWFRTMLLGKRRTIPPLTIGWSGASREMDDLVEMAEGWRRIAARYADVRFVVQGNAHAHVLLDAVPADRLTILPWTSVAEHPGTLLNIDIACAAVARTEWNLSKSGLNKPAESALAGSACVVSEWLYGEYWGENKCALVATTADEWEDALSRFIVSPELRAEYNERMQRVIENVHSMQVCWPRWPIAWARVREAARWMG